MNKNFKRFIALFLSMIMIFSAAPCGGIIMNAQATEENCGINAEWDFDPQTGALNITGTGEMSDFLKGTSPWDSLTEKIISVNVSEGITSIGDMAFYDCDNLTDVKLPKGIERIGSNAFADCESLKNIELPDSLTEIDDEAFYASGIKEITVPSSVTYIGADVFFWCVYLERINVASENNIYSSDENGVLYNADKSILIKYPSGSKLYSLEVAESVVEINDYAFENCSTLSEIVISSSVEYIGIGAFFNCYLEKIIVDEENQMYSSDENGVLFNKNKTSLIAYPINSGKTNYSIPDTVTEIEENAFHNNISLRSIVIPDGVTTIGDESFLYCDSLEYLHIPASVIYIGSDLIDSQNTYICSETENCYAKQYSDENGYRFAVCNSHAVSDIVLSESEISLINKGTYKLTATVLPENADNISVKWSSDNSQVATVDKNGVVTAVSTGVANISAVTEDGGLSAVCKVTVIPRKFRISWVIDGEKTVYYCDEGAVITEPEKPFKIGYIFNGWTPAVPDVMPESDLEFTADFSIGSYDAVFFAEGGKWADGETYKTVLTVYGEAISIPENPVRTGYEFAGWTPQIPDEMPARYLEFIAEWTPVKCNAVFDAKGGKWDDNSSRLTVSVDFDSQISSPEKPSKEGYVFDGWSPDLGIMNDVSGMTFEAKWIPADDTEYIVEFYTMDIGGENYSLEIKKFESTTDTTVNAEYSVPEGFTLNEEKSVLNGVVAADGSLVLKVYFDRSLTFVSVNGIKLEFWFGATVQEPEKPEAPEGYIQNGWLDENGDTVEFPLVVDKNFPSTITAVFVKQSYNVTWNVDGVVTEEKYDYQAEIIKPDSPVKEGYLFKGWTPEVPEIMPAYNIDFIAVFERIVYKCDDCDFETYDENEYNEHIAYEQSKKDVKISINNNPGSVTIKYGETLKLSANVTIDIADTYIFWYVDGVKKGEGETFNITFESGTKTVEAKIVDFEGEVLRDGFGNEISDSQKINMKAGFFQKLVSFFKNIFGMSRIVVQCLYR